MPGKLVLCHHCGADMEGIVSRHSPWCHNPHRLERQRRNLANHVQDRLTLYLWQETHANRHRAP